MFERIELPKIAYLSSSEVEGQRVLTFGPGAILEDPELSRLVAAIVLRYAHAENLMQELILSLLGNTVDSNARLMFTILKHPEKKLKEIVLEYGNCDFVQAFLELHKELSRIQECRHRFVHWCWCKADDLNDYALLMPPRVRTRIYQANREFSFACKTAPPNAFSHADFFDKIYPDEKKIEVWNAVALSQLDKAITGATNALVALRDLSDGKYSNGSNPIATESDLLQAILEYRLLSIPFAAYAAEKYARSTSEVKR